MNMVKLNSNEDTRHYYKRILVYRQELWRSDRAFLAHKRHRLTAEQGGFLIKRNGE